MGRLVPEQSKSQIRRFTLNLLQQCKANECHPPKMFFQSSELAFELLQHHRNFPWAAIFIIPLQGSLFQCRFFPNLKIMLFPCIEHKDCFSPPCLSKKKNIFLMTIFFKQYLCFSTRMSVHSYQGSMHKLGSDLPFTILKKYQCKILSKTDKIFVFPNLIYMFLLYEEQFNFILLWGSHFIFSQTFAVKLGQTSWEHAGFRL